MGISIGLLAVLTFLSGVLKVLGVDLERTAQGWLAFPFFAALTYVGAVTIRYGTRRWIRLICLPIWLAFSGFGCVATLALALGMI